MQKLLLLLCFAAAHFAIGQNTTSIDYKQLDFKALDKLCNAQTAEAGGVSELIGIVHNSFSFNTLFNAVINVEWSWNFDEQIQKIQTARIGALLFADPKQVKAIYKAGIAEFKTQFARMTAAERAAYLKAIDEAIVYSQQFDLAKENADLAQIEQRRGSFAREKGKINAFIYRRLAKNELTKADCIKWLKQARKDLASVKVAPKQGKESDYILQKFEYTDNLFEGYKFDNYKEKAIFTLASGSYKLLWEGKSEYINTNNHIISIASEAGDSVAFYQLGKDAKLSFITKREGYILDVMPLADFAGCVLSYYGNDAKAYLSDGNGNFEQHNVKPKRNFYWLTLKSGEKKMFWTQDYAKQQPDWSKIKNPKQLYQSNNSCTAWLLDADNKLYYLSGQDYISYQISEKIDSITTTNLGEDYLLLYYANKNTELLKANLQTKAIEKHISPQNYGYKAIEPINSEHYLFTIAGGLIGVFDKYGKIILAPEYAKIEAETSEKGSYYKLTTANGLHGRAKIDGTILIPAKYIEVTNISINRDVFWFLVRTPDSLAGLMSGDGKELLPVKYRNFISNYSFKPPYILIFEDANKKYGAMNAELKTVIPAAYTYLETNFLLNDTTLHFTFSIDGKKEIGLLDANGKVLISPNLSELPLFPTAETDGDNVRMLSNIFCGSKVIGGEQKYALFSAKTYKPITDFIFNTWSFKDTTVTFKPYTSTETVTIVESVIFYQHRAPYLATDTTDLILRQGGKQTVYDNFGKMLVPPVWDSIGFVAGNTGLYYVSNNNKWGVIDSKNNLIIAADCDVIYKHPQADFFFVGKAQADKSLKYAIFAPDGKPVTEFIYKSFDANTSSAVKLDDTSVKINEKGQEVK
jgi:hypothetical protein